MASCRPAATAGYSTPSAWRCTRPTRRADHLLQRCRGRVLGPPPGAGRGWCGSLRLLFPDERPMRHDECPMATALKESARFVAVRPSRSARTARRSGSLPIRRPCSTTRAAHGCRERPRRRHRSPPAEEESRSIARALAASNAVKDEFLGLVSHELRTPVTTIYGNARLLQARADRSRRRQGSDAGRPRLADADRLHSIIENLLYLTRLGSGVEPGSRAAGARPHRGPVRAFLPRRASRTGLVVDCRRRAPASRRDETYLSRC